MLLYNNIIKENRLNRDLYESCKINCFVRQEANNTYNIYVFTMQLRLEKELKDNWEKFINNISISFQSKLEQDVEKWNIYTIFFVEEKVSDIIKFRIEQDKFATRKIVLDSTRQYGDLFDNPSNEISQIENLINSKLFSIKIQNKNLVKEENFIQLINDKSQIYRAVIERDNRVETLLDIYREVKRSNNNA